MAKIRKGDEVVVLCGRDAGKRGKVSKVDFMRDRVLVENINIVKKHRRGDPSRGKAGGIVAQESFLHISNVAIWNQGAGKADRIGFQFLDDGRKKRYFKSNREQLDG